MCHFLDGIYAKRDSVGTWHPLVLFLSGAHAPEDMIPSGDVHRWGAAVSVGGADEATKLDGFVGHVPLESSRAQHAFLTNWDERAPDFLFQDIGRDVDGVMSRRQEPTQRIARHDEDFEARSKVLGFEQRINVRHNLIQSPGGISQHNDNFHPTDAQPGNQLPQGLGKVSLILILCPDHLASEALEVGKCVRSD